MFGGTKHEFQIEQFKRGIAIKHGSRYLGLKQDFLFGIQVKKMDMAEGEIKTDKRNRERESGGREKRPNVPTGWAIRIRFELQLCSRSSKYPPSPSPSPNFLLTINFDPRGRHQCRILC